VASETLYRVPGLPTWNAVSREFGGMKGVFAALGVPFQGTGRRSRKETMTQTRSGYVVLHEADDGAWKIVVDGVEAPTQREALNRAINGDKPEGRWLAVPASYWRPRAVKPVTVYDWADGWIVTPSGGHR
jgi:hypothetical protein